MAKKTNSTPNTVADELRELADKLDQNAKAPVDPDISIKEAIRRLRESWKRADLQIEVSWNGYESDAEVSYKFVDRSNYKTVAEDTSLKVVVEKALVANMPADTLDRLDAMLPAAKSA